VLDFERVALDAADLGSADHAESLGQLHLGNLTKAAKLLWISSQARK
jgi:hypothetical protein